MRDIMIISNLLIVLVFFAKICASEVDMMFPQLPVTVMKTTNTMCKRDSDLYVEHLNNFTLWANEMWDATAKSASGVLKGSQFQLGHYRQCLTAHAPFPTKYCLATITANIPRPAVDRDELSLNFDPSHNVLERLYTYKDVSQQTRRIVSFGWCIPANCSINDMTEYLNEYLSDVENSFTKLNVTYTAKFNELYCSTLADSSYLDNVDISFCFVSMLLIALVFLSTAYDYLKNAGKLNEKPLKKTRVTKILTAFSARENFLELTRADESNPSLRILYGVRTICILCIIMDHRFGTFLSSALLNFDFVEEQYRSYTSCIFFHGDLFVDTFFLLSGILVMYGLLNQFEKRMMNPLQLIMMRYIRLTPVYAFVIFYYATILKHTGDGPLWKVIAGEDTVDCRNNWWTNLLYISNYVNPEHMCIVHSWYLPCDFHYFIIAIFLCIWIRKERKSGLSALAVFLLISLAIPFAITVIYRRPGLMHFYPEFVTGPKVYIDFLLTYSKSHTRATPYFIGMFAGYIYYKLKGSTLHICWTKSLLTSAAAIGLMVGTILSAKVFYNPYHPYDVIEAASYAALHRLTWAVATAGLFYIASFGHGGFFSKILSWSPWIPLSKLVYGAYLTHMSFQIRSAASRMSPLEAGIFDIMTLSFSDMILAFVSSLCLYLMIEAPFRKIFRELLMPSRPANTKQTTDQPNHNNNVNSNHNMSDSRL